MINRQAERALAKTVNFFCRQVFRFNVSQPVPMPVCILKLLTLHFFHPCKSQIAFEIYKISLNPEQITKAFMF